MARRPPRRVGPVTHEEPASNATNRPATPPATPGRRAIPRVVLDTDLAGDVDDVGAVAVLHALADRGEVDLLATVVSSRCPWSPIALDALNTWHGRGRLPIGRFTGAPESDAVTSCSDAGSNYTRAIAEEDAFSTTTYRSGGALAPDALQVYRQVLAGVEDSSVTIITIGFLTALSALLDAPGDHIDQRTGIELVAAKVARVHLMGGRADDEPEYNLDGARAAAAHVLRHCPVPIVINPWEVGAQVITATTNTDRGDHIVRYAYDVFDHVHWTSTHNGHFSWDPVTVLQAVRGNRGRFTIERGTLRLDTDSGVDAWLPDPHGPHAYTRLAAQPRHLAEELEPLLWSEAAERPSTPSHGPPAAP